MHHLVLLLHLEMEEWAEEEQTCTALAGAVLVAYVASESRGIHAERRCVTCRYLTRPELLKLSSQNTPWEALFEAGGDRAFITTMEVGREAFNTILCSRFARNWYLTAIPQSVKPVAEQNVRTLYGHR